MNCNYNKIFSLFVVSLLFAGVSCGKFSSGAGSIGLKKKQGWDHIPRHCYRKTENTTASGGCYVCHKKGTPPNFINDEMLKPEDLRTVNAEKNHWSNLFSYSSLEHWRTTERSIQEYISQDNYLKNGKISSVLSQAFLTENQDTNSDGEWRGFVPDFYLNRIEHGFDQNPQGEDTGWVAYSYLPLPGAEMPEEGVLSRILIRLPEEFRKNEEGSYDRKVYLRNLQVLESIVKGKDIEIRADSMLSEKGISRETLRFAFKGGKIVSPVFVGMAGKRQKMDQIKIAPGLFPMQTEFLQVVYYPSLQGGVLMPSARIKEIRYAKKVLWRSYFQLRSRSEKIFESRIDKDHKRPSIKGNKEYGIGNRAGWKLFGYIENKTGDLRPQTSRELESCFGCHGSIGAGTDSVFSFSRKYESDYPEDGWIPMYSALDQPLPDQNFSSGYEFEKYISARNGVGIAAPDQYDRSDIRKAITPDQNRLNELNKQYKRIVSEQSYVFGRVVLPDAKKHYKENLDDH